MLPEFLFHFVRQKSFRRDGEANMTGSVGQKRVPADWLKSVQIQQPPLAEQRRIVEKVEAVLARVNAARQGLAKAPALLKRFRQSVLAAACSGRLTADWRTSRDHEPSGVALASKTAGAACAELPCIRIFQKQDSAFHQRSANHSSNPRTTPRGTQVGPQHH